MKITISYDVIDKTVNIEENDFTNLEALGILEAAKVLVIENLYEEEPQ